MEKTILQILLFLNRYKCISISYLFILFIYLFVSIGKPQ